MARRNTTFFSKKWVHYLVIFLFERNNWTCITWSQWIQMAFSILFSHSVMSNALGLWTAAHQASLFFNISWRWLKLMSIESVMPSNYLVLCRPLLLLPTIFPSIRVFSKEYAFCIRWLKYWSFSFSISPSNEYSGFPLAFIDWISLQSKGFWWVYSNTTVQKHPLFSAQTSLWSSSHIHTWLLEKP